MSKRVALSLITVAVCFAAAGCQAGAPKTRKVLPEWSRGVLLGTAGLNQSVDMVPEDDCVHLIWVAAESNGLHYVRLDNKGDVVVSRDLGVTGAHPSDARVLRNSDGSLAVLWTDNPNMPRALFQARLNRDGDLLEGPVQVSPAGIRVSKYDVVLDGHGNQHVFWANEIPSEGGLHYLRVSADGQFGGTDRVLVSGGEHPTAQQGAGGAIHLAWVVEPATRLNYVYYAVFDPASESLGHETRVALYKTATGLIPYPPVMGLDDSGVYLFWALEQRGGGLSQGEARSYYVAFPFDDPRETEPVEVGVPPIARPDYVEASGVLPYARLASGSAAWPTSLLYQPATLQGLRAELGVFLVAEVATQRQASKEVVWVIYADGEMKGYQLPTVLGLSLRPTCGMDEHGNVHLAWLNSGGFGRYDVYYASTSDAVKANLDRITMQDRAEDVLGGLWALAPALGFFPPVFLLWTFAPFIWVVLFYFVKVEGGLDRRPAQIALVVAIVLYLSSKLFLMPGPLFYAPFQDRLPSNLQFIPVVATPIFTLVASLGAVWMYFRRREFRSLFVAFLILVGTDAFLSLIIYVPRWLAG